MLSSSKRITLQPPTSRTDVMVRKWLVFFGSQFNRGITPLIIATWCELLEDLDPEKLELALVQTAKTCHFFPSPADVRSQIDKANAKAMELEAEQAWQRAMDYAVSYWHPDIGFTRNAPTLSARVEHAIRAAGGVSRLFNCPESELHWRKKDFVADYLLLHELEHDRHLLTDNEAKEILKQISAESQRVLEQLPEKMSTEQGERRLPRTPAPSRVTDTRMQAVK